MRHFAAQFRRLVLLAWIIIPSKLDQTPSEFTTSISLGRWGKSDSPDITGNGAVGSGYQWVVSSVDVKDEKLSLDKLSTTKIINLINNSTAESHCSAHEDPLCVCTLDIAGVECIQQFVSSLVSASHPEISVLQGSNLDANGLCRNVGLPKVRKDYGNGIFILGIMVGNTTSKSPRTSYGEKMGRQYSTGGNRGYEHPKGNSFTPSSGSPLIISKCEKVVTFTPLESSKLIHAIAHPDVLWLAYDLIKSKPGNMTRGATNETLDGLTMQWIYRTGEKIRAGKYKFGHGRRIRMAKVAKPGKRPLIMASPREKIVQKAIQMVVQELFEPRFSNTSHGFRLGRGYHTALQMVDQNFRGGKWVIEADITKCFDTIPHHKLLAVLSRSITCTKTLALIGSSLKAGYVCMGLKVQDKIVGTPQGSILSPLLCNIFMHELDMFMEQLTVQHKQGSSSCRKKNPAFRKLQYEISKTTDPRIAKTLRRKMWSIPSKDPMDSNFQRLAYVRYAHHFIICVSGPRQRAVDIMEQVRIFLDKQLGVELNRSKTLITKFSDGINFLGATITNRKVDQKPIKLMTSGPAKGHCVRVTPRLSFHAPIRKLIDRLVVRGYMKWSVTQNKAVATALRSMVNMDHTIILKLYNSVIRGILNYYTFADNRKSLGNIVHSLKWSCALTLALKYKLRTAAKAYKTFGPKLKCPSSKLEVHIPKTFARLEHLLKFNSRVDTTPDQAIKLCYTNRFTRSSLGQTCVICGESNVEMHHVRKKKKKKLRELRKRLHLDWFTRQMAAINRKQVPLCANHHHRLHSGTLSNAERELFRAGCRNLVVGGNNTPARKGIDSSKNRKGSNQNAGVKWKAV